MPNRFPDIGEQPEYNTIDASLWFVHAVIAICTTVAIWPAFARAWPAIKQILDGRQARDSAFAWTRMD